ncbi:hypothetical protein [Capillibacterium thermochitinicola]|uniref:Uncharacterized protein n=1 Tax=Capillibacterium thermochitinicola TaxID=2699427 RepID=A0A8J6I124_9FIRM|nr:hypothetical protein [Capillibacterium thermochitinicola]MBA2132352.1 hypothetical protein [Capillibacterium thermochitinicola]
MKRFGPREEEVAKEEKGALPGAAAHHCHAGGNVYGTSASKVKLVVWGRDLPDDDPAHAYIKALINGFRAKNPDIDLEYLALGDPGLMDKTKVAMANNRDLPHIFQS